MHKFWGLGDPQRILDRVTQELFRQLKVEPDIRLNNARDHPTSTIFKVLN